jgi:hypothetical protein
VIPVPKKSSCLSVSDYRPINILPVLSKVFEDLAKDQVLGHVGVCDLLTSYQSGYRAGCTDGPWRGICAGFVGLLEGVWLS